jgi:hypothetical protein
MTMNRIVVHSRVGADGVLQLAVPLGVAEADREVEVTIEPAAPEQTTGSEQELLDQYPTLRPEHIRAAMMYAADVVTMDESI